MNLMQWKVGKEPQILLDERIQGLQRRREWKTLGKQLILTGLVVWLLFGKFFGVARVQGTSMNPALQENDMVLFFRPAKEYKAGDIVLMDADDNLEYIKRIAALPGQTVDFDEGRGTLLIDGEPLPEPYIYEESHRKKILQYPITLGEKEYFLLGDHRSNSLDSRNFGAVPEKQLDGRVFAVLRTGL